MGLFIKSKAELIKEQQYSAILTKIEITSLTGRDFVELPHILNESIVKRLQKSGFKVVIAGNATRISWE